MLTSTKQKAVTIETKVAMTVAIAENRRYVTDVCNEFGLGESTVFTILRHRKILKMEIVFRKPYMYVYVHIKINNFLFPLFLFVYNEQIRLVPLRSL